MAAFGGMRQRNVKPAGNERTKSVDELDPYVKVTMDPFGLKKKTKEVQDAGHDADWTEKHDHALRFVFPQFAEDPEVEPTLKVEIFDEDVGRDEYLGQALVPLWALIDVDRYRVKIADELAVVEGKKRAKFLRKAEDERALFLIESNQGRLQTTVAKKTRQSLMRRMSAPDVPKEDFSEPAQPATPVPTESTELADSPTTAAEEESITAPHNIANGMVKKLMILDPKGDAHKGYIELMITWTPANTMPSPTPPPEAVAGNGLPSSLPPLNARPEGGLPPQPPTGPASGSPAPRSSPRATGGALTAAPAQSNGSKYPLAGGVLVVTILRGRGMETLDAASFIDMETDKTLIWYSSIAFVLYMVLGCLFYHFVEENCDEIEGSDGGTIQANCVSWTVIDALYFTVMTFTTVGYGDIGPSSPSSRVFTAVFALVGVSLIGSALGIIAGYVMEILEMRMSQAMDTAKKEGRNPDQEKANLMEQRTKERKKGVYMNFVYMMLVICAGTVMFVWHEEVTFVDAFYGAVITSCSIGYGDVSFSGQLGRGLATLYMMTAVLTMSNFVGGISGYIIDMKQQELIQKALKKNLRVSDIIEMDEDDDGEVDRLEFLAKMLVRLRKCEKSDVDEILQQFDVLDIDNSGTLTYADILKGEEAGF